MKDPKKIAAKRLKRKRTLEKRKRIIREMTKNIIVFGGKMYRKKPAVKKEKPKVVKVVKPYLAVKLTAKLDQLTVQIREANANDPKLPSLKARRDAIKKRLNQK